MTANDSRNDIPLMRIPPKYPGESCSDLQVLQCGKHADKRHRLANRFDFYALVMITKGSGTFRCDDGPVQQVRAGDVIYLKPGPAFFFGPPKGGYWDEYHCCVTGERLQQWCERRWIPHKNQVWRLPNTEVLSNFYQRINSYHSGHTHGNRDRAILTAEQLFVEAFHRRRHPGHEDDHLVRSCLGLCHERLAEPLHFTDIADELGVSYSLLRQRIRQSTGQSPAKLLLQMRCNYAQELLQDPELTIQQIATECGFDDPYTFSRSFKRSVGVAPSYWRERLFRWRGGA